MGWLVVLGAIAASPMGCQGADAPLSARIDPLRASEADMSAEIEREVEGLETAQARMRRRLELVDELIEARAAAEGRLPPAGAPAAEWQAFYEYYAPLTATLLDEMVPEDQVRAAMRESDAAFRERRPSPDDIRLAREAAATLGVHPIDEEVSR
jgi:hypothetical protein